LREGTVVELEVPLWVPRPLIPHSLLENQGETPLLERHGSATSMSAATNGYPAYLVVGGLVFTPATREYLRSEFKTEHAGDLAAGHGSAEELRLLGMLEQHRHRTHAPLQKLSYSCLMFHFLACR
jgi:hypothetical protein